MKQGTQIQKSNINEQVIEDVVMVDPGKQKCVTDLDSDAEDDGDKNVGCDFCPKWFHLKCTKFVGLPYNDVEGEYFKCEFCGDKILSSIQLSG